MNLWDSRGCPVGYLTIASGYSFVNANLPPRPSHTAPPLPESAWSLPTCLSSWERAGPASTLPALPGDQYCLLAYFPNKCLHAPSLLTHLCLGEASHTPPPNHFLHCGAGEHREPSYLLYPQLGTCPTRFPSAPHLPDGWWLGVLLGCLLWDMYILEKEPSFIVL